MENCETEKICRLCLGKVQSELEENLYISAIQMLDLCLPEMDKSLCSDCAFCLGCFNCLKGIYVFKRKCLQTEEKIRLYLENCDPSNVNLKHIVECVSIIKEDGSVICRSCLSISAEPISVHIDNSNFGLVLKNMFMTCIPEMDLNLLDNPIICMQCVDVLKKFYSFKSKCLQTEEEIVTFKEENKFQIVNLAGLIKIQESKENDNREQITSDKKFKFEEYHKSIGNIEKMDISPELQIKTENLGCVESNLMERNSENFKPEGHFHFVNCGFIDKNEESHEPPMNEEDPNLPIRLQALSENATNPHVDTLTWHTCDICSYQSKWKHHLERHKQVHEAELNHNRSFKCFKCGFVAQYKHALLRHSTMEHGDWFKCAECDYQTKWKRSYNQHLLNHKGGQIWHHCELCSYKTKWKYHLKRHMVTHQ